MKPLRNTCMKKMKMMTRPLVGIDYSMTSPGVYIQTKDKSYYYYRTPILKYGNIHHEEKYFTVAGSVMINQYPDVRRYIDIAEWVVQLFDLHELDDPMVYIEGYSMGSKGKVFNIAENGGVLKNILWQELEVLPISIPPKTVKSFATGNGNAKKDEMYDAFKKLTKIDLVDILQYEKKDIDSPIGDIVDSFWVAKTGLYTDEK